MENKGLALVFLLDIFCKKKLITLAPTSSVLESISILRTYLAILRKHVEEEKKEKTIDLLINDLGESLSDLDCVQRIQMTSLVVSKDSSSWVILIWLV